MADSNSFVWRDFVEETLNGSRCVYLEPADGEFIPEQNLLRIITSSTWARDSIQRRHTPTMKAILQRRHPNETIELEYVVTPESDSPRPARILDDATEIAPALPVRQRGPAVVPIGKDRPSGLNPQYVFERFIIGSSNRLAAATAMSVSERPRQWSMQPALSLRRKRTRQDASAPRHRKRGPRIGRAAQDALCLG